MPTWHQELDKLLSWPQLHLCELQGEGIPVVSPVDSLVTRQPTKVLPVQVDIVTSVVPPGACLAHSTVPTPLIIIPVLGAELHVVVVHH